MKRLKNQFLNLAAGELAAVVVFVFVSRLLNFGAAAWAAFSCLIFILLQGSMYWLYRYLLIRKKREVHPNVIRILSIARMLNLVLLAAIGLTVPFVRNSTRDLIIAAVIFLFGVVEYINYYWYRLSYGRSGFNIRLLLSNGLKKSSISKLIARAST